MLEQVAVGLTMLPLGSLSIKFLNLSFLRPPWSDTLFQKTILALHPDLKKEHVAHGPQEIRTLQLPLAILR